MRRDPAARLVETTAGSSLELGVELMGSEAGGDLPELGVRPRRDDDTPSASGVHDGSHQRATGEIRQRRTCWHLVGVLGGGQGLPGQHRLVALQAADPQQAEIGRDHISQAEFNDIARDERGDVDLPGKAVTDGDDLVVDLGVQGVGGFLRTELVDETQAHRQDHDAADDQRAAALADKERRYGSAEQQT